MFKDPIGLAGNNPTLYAYVSDSNTFIDPLGLEGIFTLTTFQAPSVANGGTGHTYNVYEQDIDWDMEFNGKGGKKYTNLDLASEGKAPFVVKNGKRERVNLHHSNQQGQGPLFHLATSTHNKYGYTNILHPYKKAGIGKNPLDPKNDARFDVDRDAYWKDRAERERKRRNQNYK